MEVVPRYPERCCLSCERLSGVFCLQVVVHF